MIVEDVSEARALEADILHQARHDALTGLPNRREIEQQLQFAIDSAIGEGREHVFCFVDLDQFKLVNDTLGTLLKYQDDIAKIQGSEAAKILAEVNMKLAAERQ